MGLLDKLENQIAKHPLEDETYEIKVNYLNAIAFFIAIDDRVTEYEKKSFDKIIELLNCDGAKDDLYDFMEHPNLDEFENTFKFINEKGYFITYLLEVFYFQNEKEFNEFESRFVAMVADISDYTNDELNKISQFAKYAQNKDEEKLIALFKQIVTDKKLFNSSKEFYYFYKLSHRIKGVLAQIDKQRKEILNSMDSLRKMIADEDSGNQSEFYKVFKEKIKIILKLIALEMKSQEIEIQEMKSRLNKIRKRKETSSSDLFYLPLFDDFLTQSSPNEDYKLKKMIEKLDQLKALQEEFDAIK